MGMQKGFSYEQRFQKHIRDLLGAEAEIIVRQAWEDVANGNTKDCGNCDDELAEEYLSSVEAVI